MVESSAKSMSYLKEAIKTFSAEFLDDALCNYWFISLSHPSGPRCPKCGKEIIDNTTLKNFNTLKRCNCKFCNHSFTAKSKTILPQGSKLSVREFFLLSLLLGFGIEIKEIARILKIHPVTVNLWQKKIEIMGKHEILG